MVKCFECSKELNRITNTHLKSCCNLSMVQYAMKYGLDLIQLVDIDVIERTKDTMRSRLPQLLPIRREKRRKRYVKAVEFLEKEMLNEEKQVLYGSLLGDGYIFRAKAFEDNTYFCCDHGVAQFSYLAWKRWKLRRFDAKIFQRILYSEVAHRVVSASYLTTLMSSYFGKLGRMFYNSEGKKVPNEIFKELDDLGVAVWYMDDGYYTQGTYTFCTESFSVEDRQKLVEFLNKRYGANFREDNAQHLICCHSKIGIFVERIKPHLLEMFYYKIGKNYGECTLVKRFEIDAGHFLEDYAGKCLSNHGHLYWLDVGIYGAINPDTGMVLDYSYIKQVVKKYVVDVLDHHIINYVVPELRRRATAELMAVWIWKVLIELLPGLSFIELHEKPNSSWLRYVGPSRDEVKKGCLDPLLKWAELSWQDLLKKYPEIGKFEILYLAETFKEESLIKKSRKLIKKLINKGA